MSAARYLVHGRVQGVGFRWFVMREATRLDLAGYVCNQPDGTVEVIAEGPGAALAALESALRHGPPVARVEGVDKTDLPQQIDSPKPFGVK